MSSLPLDVSREGGRGKSLYWEKKKTCSHEKKKVLLSARGSYRGGEEAGSSPVNDGLESKIALEEGKSRLKSEPASPIKPA